MLMAHAGRLARPGMVTLLAVALTAGCRDHADPGDAYPENLGQDGRILTPVAVGHYAPSAKLDAQAELKRIDRSAKTETSGDSGAVDERQPEEAAGAGTPASEAIAELVTIHNEIVAEKAWNEYAELFVERQRPTVTQLVELQTQFIPKVEALLKAVEEKAPQSVDKVKQFRDRIAAIATPLSITDLNLVGETEATARVVLPEGAALPPGLSPTITFRMVRNTWFLESPLVDIAALVLPSMPKVMSDLDQLTAAINSGDLDAAAVGERLDAILSALGGGQAAPPQEAPPDAPDGEGTGGQDDAGGGNDNAGG